jgi:glycosyltransferase involved in cell wall biosynthesis
MTVTVILATRNRAALLERTVSQLQGQVRAAGARIVVVDNGSTDDTPRVLDRLKTTLPLTALCEPSPGKNRALNRALDVAEGDLLIFTDDDVDFAPDWIAQLLRAANAWPEHGVFGGPIIPRYASEIPTHLRAYTTLKQYAFSEFELGGVERTVSEIMPFGPNFAVRRAAMGAERFDPRIGPLLGDNGPVPLGDETEFLWRLSRATGKFVYVPAAWVHHHVEPHQFVDSWLFERSFRAGRSCALLEPDRAATRFAGVPRYLWRRVVEAHATYWSWPFRGAGRFDAGLRLHYLKGQIYQYRRGSLEDLQEVQKVQGVQKVQEVQRTREPRDHGGAACRAFGS